MTRFIFAAILAAALTSVAADKAVTFTASGTVVDGVDIRQTADGGFEVTSYGHNEANGIRIQHTRTCAVSALTTAQKAALATIRTAALACWNNAEGL